MLLRYYYSAGSLGGLAASKLMDDPNNTTGSDEDILTYTVSDEAIEAAAGMEREAVDTAMWRCTSGVWTCMYSGCPGKG